MKLLRLLITCFLTGVMIVPSSPVGAISSCSTGRSGPTGTSVCQSSAGAGTIQRVGMYCSYGTSTWYGPIYGPFTGVGSFSFKTCPSGYPHIASIWTDKF